MVINKKNGVSLLILVISIIVTLILVSAIIVLVVNNNPIFEAKKTAFLSDLKNFKTELDIYNNQEYSNNRGRFNMESLQADAFSVTYDGVKDETKTMYDLIPTLGKTTKYHGKFIIVNGELVYVGDDDDEKIWVLEIGVSKGEPKVTFTHPIVTSVSPGIDIIYTINFTSTVAIETINLTGKVEVINSVGVKLIPQPNILIGEASGTSTDIMRQVVVTITTDDLTNGVYKLKIKSGSAMDFNKAINSKDVISPIGFNINNVEQDNTPPDVATLSINPTSWTKGNVTVTITYPFDAVIKEYSTNGVLWNTYTTGVIVSENNTTVYARGEDDSGNQSEQSSITITNIDKTAPTISASNGGLTTSSVKVNASASDSGGSSLNSSSYQYSKDNGTTWTAASSLTNYTFNELTAGTYQCRVRVADNAGNTSTSSAVALTTTGIGSISMLASPTGWTNGNVTVAITYPSEIVTKQYSTNGSTWVTYTAAVAVSTNCTVYARGFDSGNNQTAQATITITKIDTISPTITAINGGATTSSVTVNATASDTGVSGLNSSSYQYSKDNGTTWTAASSLTNHTFNGLTTGTYQCRARVSDNAGNITTSSAVALSTTGLGTISMSASPTGWTNGNVTVTITYPAETVTKQYNINGGTWISYTTSVIVSENCTVYARGFDSGNNQTAQATITVTKIDKTAPTITASNGGATTSSVTVNAAASDTGVSGLNSSSYQYSKDNGTTWTAASSLSNYTFNTLSSGTYQCRVKVADNAGNTSTSSAVALTTTGIGSISMSASPTGWTNGNVTVTITYPSEIVTKEYSTNGSTWITYTSAVVVSTNCTVYARGFDSGNNQTAQATITITKIDTISPTITATNGGSTTSSVTVNATASDTGVSGLNSSSYRYSKDNGTTWTAASSLTNYTFNGLTSGTYQCRARVSDNAGNTATSSAVSLTTTVAYNTINGLPYAYNNPVIPQGFTALTTTDASWSNVSTDWNKGLVIQDASGNQFVWVPVDGSNVSYSKWPGSMTSSCPLPSGVSSEFTQIATYGGFYIGRYEAGNSFGTLVSKAYVWPWNNINYTNAKNLAQSMYTGSAVKSGLLTGYHWDTTMKWIQNSGKSVSENSSNWGNYIDSTWPANVYGCGSIQSTLYSEYWKAKNIYDIAGNVMEWTSEVYESTNYSYRGGSYAGGGGNDLINIPLPACSWFINVATTSINTVGFRVVLYVM